MIVVLIGPHGVGKTTLAQLLAEKHLWEVRTPPAEHRRDDLAWAAKELSSWAALDHDVVFDGFPYPDNHLEDKDDDVFTRHQWMEAWDVELGTGDFTAGFVFLKPADSPEYAKQVGGPEAMATELRRAEAYERFVNETWVSHLTILVDGPISAKVADSVWGWSQFVQSFTGAAQLPSLSLSHEEEETPS